MEEIRRPKPSLSDVLPKQGSSRPRVMSPEPIEPRLVPRRTTGGGKRFLFWLIILIIIGGPAVFYGSRAFTSVKVTVEPRHESFTLDELIIAKRVPQQDPETTEPNFQVMTLDTSETGAVTASGSEKVEEKARGEIVIYNDFSAESQALVANTRFESPTGKIYRSTAPVTVPGQKTVDGKLVPGSVTATIVADEAGESYNGGLTDFKIPGFKGGPRYDKFSARSKTPLTGGFVGNRPSIAAADRERVLKELESTLKDRLLKEAAISVPPGFIMFGESVFFDFEILAVGGETNGSANLTVKGTLSGIMFDRLELSRYLAINKINDLDSSVVNILEPEKLNFDLLTTETFDPELTQTIRFKLTGPALFVWVYDHNKLLADLAGKKRDDYQTIFTQYPTITKATAEFTPSWGNRFPTDTSKITVVDAL